MATTPVQPRRMPRWFGAGRAASERITARFHASSSAQMTVYHYTDTAALLSIVRSSEMWLSDATFLNDRTELDCGLNLVRSGLANAQSDPVNTDLADLLRMVSSLFDTKMRLEVYVCCFFRKGDDLAQWRAYGNRGAGVAIGVSPDPLMFGYSSESLLMEVFYQVAEQIWIANAIIDAYVTAFRQDRDNPIASGIVVGPDEEMRICAESLYHALWRYVVAFKDAAFASESEVRYIYLAHHFESKGLNWVPKHPTPLFRERAGIVIPYLTSTMLEFGPKAIQVQREHPSLPIVEVIIGPSNQQDIVARGIRQVLDAYGHSHAQIKLSHIPFRG